MLRCIDTYAHSQAVFDIPEAIAIARRAICAAQAAGGACGGVAAVAGLGRLQVLAYYWGMAAYYW